MISVVSEVLARGREPVMLSPILWYYAVHSTRIEVKSETGLANRMPETITPPHLSEVRHPSAETSKLNRGKEQELLHTYPSFGTEKASQKDKAANYFVPHTVCSAHGRKVIQGLPNYTEEVHLKARVRQMNFLSHTLRVLLLSRMNVK